MKIQSKRVGWKPDTFSHGRVCLLGFAMSISMNVSLKIGFSWQTKGFLVVLRSTQPTSGNRIEENHECVPLRLERSETTPDLEPLGPFYPKTLGCYVSSLPTSCCHLFS